MSWCSANGICWGSVRITWTTTIGPGPTYRWPRTHLSHGVCSRPARAVWWRCPAWVDSITNTAAERRESMGRISGRHRLEGHPGRHEEWSYLPYGMQLQKRFFDYYLKGEQNGWNKEPRVWLNLRRPFTESVELRKENAWPLQATRWTKLYLDAEAGALDWKAPSKEGRASFEALGENLKWLWPPLEQETEITGPLALKVPISSSTVDADLFVTVQAFSPDGREVEFQGTLDPHTPLAQGWLRASHRKLDPARSKPWQPY